MCVGGGGVTAATYDIFHINKQSAIRNAIAIANMGYITTGSSLMVHFGS